MQSRRAGALRHPGVKLLALVLILQLTLPAFSSPPVGLSTSSGGSLSSPPLGFKLVGGEPTQLPITVTVEVPLRNLDTLYSMVESASDPTSPQFRHFLSAQQAGAEFLPYAQFSQDLYYLQSMGFQIELTALHSVIVAEGTVAQFQSAFGEGVDKYSNGTASYYADSGSATLGGAYVYASNATALLAHPQVPHGSGTDGNVTFTESTFSMTSLQEVYNVTALYSEGFTGAGENIGILDFYGSPSVGSDLALYDQTFGLPSSNLIIRPVGPYDPNLGVSEGWNTEISLDVEAAHTMAPSATIELYAANGALPLSVPIATVVQDDNVTTLSQSFGIPEWYYSLTAYLGGPAFLGENAIIPDQYYALGSLEGISFLASSGDGGGSGFSSGPEGAVEYPSTSPFVTSVGGTQTYFSTSASGNQTYVETAWSNIGYVPNVVNEGGTTGGVSILEPKPWYQANLTVPASYPDGRLGPDLSLQGGVDPASLMVAAGTVQGVGGTSESVQLLSGLLAVVSQAVSGRLGLINPFLYDIGSNPADYAKAFTPITYGYTIPWTASKGFNLVTGWGAPNVGEMALMLEDLIPTPTLTVSGTITNSTGLPNLEYTEGQSLTVQAQISRNGLPVTTGSFSLTLDTLSGATSPVAMTYDSSSGNWTGTFIVGAQSGLADVVVSGTSLREKGTGIGEVFLGYLGTLVPADYPYILTIDPWTWSAQDPLTIASVAYYLNGTAAPPQNLTLGVESYSIRTNSYTTRYNQTLTSVYPGVDEGNLTVPVPNGPVSFVLEDGTYSYSPSLYGIWLQTSYIYTQVAAEPGAVPPGGDLTIIASPVAPVPIYFTTSYETGESLASDIAVGSNVTASLISPSGRVVSQATLSYQACAQALRVCDGGADTLYGQLPVPTGVQAGLYTVNLTASYASLTPGGNVTGTFYGQVWVSGPAITPMISVGPGFVSSTATSINASSSQLFEGEPAHVAAAIDYENGTAVKYGEFTALVYPQSLEGEYTYLMHSEYVATSLVQLSYDPSLGVWLGNVSLPGPSGLGSLSALGGDSFSYSGPYAVFVTGISPGGYTTATDLSAQQTFGISPYAFVTGQVTSLGQGSQIAFSGAIVAANGSLTGVEFLGPNEVKGASLAVTGSQLQGELVVEDSNLTLTDVSGGSIVALNSTVSLRDSSVASLSLVGSKASLVDSTYTSVSPALPTISVTGLAGPLSGNSPYSVTVSGEGLTTGSVSFFIDGVQVYPQVNATGLGVVSTGTINATALPDGTHTLEVTTQQSDGLSSSLATTFSTDAKAVALSGDVKTLTSQQGTLFGLFYGLDVFVVLILIALALSSRRGRKAGAPPAAEEPTPQPQQGTPASGSPGPT